MSSAVRADSELVCVFVPENDEGRELLKLTIDGSKVASIRPSERVLASALRYALYPSHCSLAEDHVPLTVC